MLNITIALVIFILLYTSWKMMQNITLTDFLSNSKSTGTYPIFMSLLASLIGGWMFLGLTQMSYEAGLVGLYIGIGYALGFFLLFKFAKKIKIKMDTLDSHTLDEIMYKYYGKKVGILIIIVNFIFFISVLCAQFIVLKQILLPFSHLINVDLIFWLFSFAVLIYTALTGYKGVLATDKFQLLFIVILVFMLLFSLNDNQLINNLNIIDTSYFLGTNYGISFALAVIILFPLTVLVRTDLWQRIGSAKNIESSKKAILLTIPFLFISYILMVYIGISINTMNIPTQEGIAPLISLINHITQNSSSNIFNILIFTVLMGMGAALMSTIDSNLNVVVSAITRVKNFKNPLFIARILSIIIGLLGILASILISDLVDIIISAGAIILILFPVILNFINTDSTEASIYEKKNALYSLIVGYSSFILFVFILGVKIAFIPAFLITLTFWHLFKYIYKNKLLNNHE